MDKTYTMKDKAYTLSQDEKSKQTQTAFHGHKLELDHHRMFSMTGVKDVPVFTDKNITVTLDGETLNIAGQDLAVKNLDIENGKLSVTGSVHSLKYSSQGSASLVKRIFK